MHPNRQHSAPRWIVLVNLVASLMPPTPDFLDFFVFLFFFCGFWGPEVSQRPDLEILLQMGSGRARDDFKMPRSGTGTITSFGGIEDFL